MSDDYVNIHGPRDSGIPTLTDAARERCQGNPPAPAHQAARGARQRVTGAGPTDTSVLTPGADPDWEDYERAFGKGRQWAGSLGERGGRSVSND